MLYIDKRITISFLTRRPRLLRINGFTLIELLLTLSIAAIIVTIAIPSYSSFTLNNQITSQLNTFVTALNITRSEAVKRGTTVTICKSTNLSSCDSTNNGWNMGWIVFVDLDNDADVDTGEEILVVNDGFSNSNTLSGESGSDVKNFVTYLSNGTTTFPLTAGEVELILCDKRKDDSVSKTISISPTGRVSSASATESALSCES